MGSSGSANKQKDRAQYMPVFKDAASFANKRIQILRDDFCIHVTVDEEAYIRSFADEFHINAACKNIINRHWN